LKGNSTPKKRRKINVEWAFGKAGDRDLLETTPQREAARTQQKEEQEGASGGCLGKIAVEGIPAAGCPFETRESAAQVL